MLVFPSYIAFDDAGSVPDPLTADVDTQIATGLDFYDGSPPAPVIFTNDVTATGVDGVPPYTTFLWTEIGGPSGIHITNPTSATTTFWAQQASPGAYVKTGEFKCTVGDSNSDVADTPVVDVEIEQTT